MTLKLEEPQVKRWTREEYYRLAEEGWFEGERVLLLEGEIIEMPPQGYAHTKALVRMRTFLEAAFGKGYWVREEKPLNVGQHSDPEPDLAVVEGTLEDFEDHPKTAVVVVEIADTSLQLDRKKADLYASAGVEEYWIVNLQGRKLEVHRAPTPDASAAFGYRYDEVFALSSAENASLKSNPKMSMKISELFI